MAIIKQLAAETAEIVSRETTEVLLQRCSSQLRSLDRNQHVLYGRVRDLELARGLEGVYIEHDNYKAFYERFQAIEAENQRLRAALSAAQRSRIVKMEVRSPLSPPPSPSRVWS